VNQDQEHLKLLSIFHFVLAGLCGMLTLIPLAQLLLGLGLATGSLDKEPVAQVMGCFFVAIAGTGLLLGVGLAVCLVLAGRAMLERKHYTFCLVMACISCMFMPFGTALGVFSLLVLLRPSVKTLFGVGNGPAAGDSQPPGGGEVAV
jgi:hypothetical protein